MRITRPNWTRLTLLIALIALPLAALRLRPATARQSAPPSARTPVIVELFTSEGCSSCPPADAFLANLDAQQRIPGAEVIALEEHVDYWDQLGWRDPFSSPGWTERQRNYAEVFRTGSIYTPQMIVNGTTEFVGSRERQGREAIAEAARRATAQITLTAAAAGKNAAEVKVQVSPLQSAAGDEPELWLAVTETGLHNAVTAGENAGADLRHAAVARKLQRLGRAVAPNAALAGKGAEFTAKIALDSRWKPDNIHIVAFVQERRSLRILAAARVPLSH